MSEMPKTAWFDNDLPHYMVEDVQKNSTSYVRADKVAKLEAALRWYADPISYGITQQNEPRSAVHGDQGKIAREALKETTQMDIME